MLSSLVIGSLCGLFFAWFMGRLRHRSTEKIASRVIRMAEEEREYLLTQGRQTLEEEKLRQKQDLSEYERKSQENLEVERERIRRREDELDRALAKIGKEIGEINEARRAKELALTKIKEYEEKLSLLASWTKEQAREQLLREVEGETREMAAQLTKTTLDEAKTKVERQSKEILTTALTRIRLPSLTEQMLTTITLPRPEMKGRIIGRDGRNIRTLEQLTGVTILMDETPGAIVLSGFDPIRKEIARLTLKELLADGRIHPSRIEEVYEQTEKDLGNNLVSWGEKAANESKVYGLSKRLLELLGVLNLRLCYTQNLLSHCVEVSHLLGLLCAEVGLDEALGRRIGLLHDIGKALGQEHEGSHAQTGALEAKKQGEDDLVVNGIACHHGEEPPLSLEASLCSTADSLSGGRPGARIEALAQTIQRQKALEALAKEMSGVEEAYALSAGRELRVMVQPEQLDDAGATNLARELMREISKNIPHRGKIQITVIRQTRTVEYTL